MGRFEEWAEDYIGYVGPWEVSFLGVRSGEFHMEEILKLAELLLPHLLETQAEVAA